MAQINVVKPFKLNIDGTLHDYTVGLHNNVDQEIADHWYVQAHIEDLPVDEPEQVAETLEEPVSETKPAKPKKPATE